MNFKKLDTEDILDYDHLFAELKARNETIY